MTVGPYPVDKTIERIRDKVPLARLVGDAAGLDAALRTPPNTAPAIFVLRDERGGAEKYSGGGTSIQNIDVTLRIALLVRNVSGEQRGTGARALADQVAAQLRAALCGWTPDASFNAITFVASRNDRYLAGWLADQEQFRTDYRLQNQVTP